MVDVDGRTPANQLRHQKIPSYLYHLNWLQPDFFHQPLSQYQYFLEVHLVRPTSPSPKSKAGAKALGPQKGRILCPSRDANRDSVGGLSHPKGPQNHW